MKKKFFFLLGGLLLSAALFSQDWSSVKEPPTISSVNYAARMAGEILDAVGLEANFQVAEAEVPNAMAVVQQGNRYILYNPGFIERLTLATGTRWAAVSVLAHEIGHHLYPSGQADRLLATELEADAFSGYVLQKMGATLEEAQAAMKVLGTKYATETHPAAADRMASIEKGWNLAGGVTSNQEEIRYVDPHEESGGEPASSQSTVREKLLPEGMIAGVFRFSSDPANEYYLTTRLTIVKFDGKSVRQIGKVTRSNSNDYPYIIYDDSGYQLYINRQGYIYNSHGNELGQLIVRS